MHDISIIKIIILGVTQGLTEFIPVSSSGHLIVMQNLLGVSELGQIFDIALHFGTLLALIIYFHKDIVLLAQGLIKKTEQSGLAWMVALATVPAVFAGLLLDDTIESLRSSKLVAFNLILVAGLMLYAEKHYKKTEHKKELNRISAKSAWTVGLAQAAALIPGISRSGATITAGLFSRIDRVAAARFSFLMAIPITFGAVLKTFASSGTLEQLGQEKQIFVVGTLAAFVSGVFAIRFLMKYLAKHTLKNFAYYRIAIGLIIFILL